MTWKKVKQDPNGAINSGSKFFERILNILLENARIPPKETYVEKIIDLKIRKSLIPNQRNCFKKQENTVMMIDIVILRQMKEWH